MAISSLRFLLRSLTVPSTLPHKSRAEEIEELVEYLEVVADISPGLTLLNVGDTEPGSDTSDFPWLKLDAGGNPLGLFVNVGGIWKPAVDRYFLREQNDDQYVQRGEITVNMDVSADDIKTFTDEIEFDDEFDEVPIVTCSIVGGTLFESTGAGTYGWAAAVIPVNISTESFGLKIASEMATDSTNKTVKIAWEAVGALEVD